MIDIHRTDKSKGNFTQIDNDLLFNPTLNAKTKVLLMQIICMQPSWQISIPYLTKINLDGETSIRSGLKELETKGYLEHRHVRNDLGQYVRIDHIVYEHLDLAHPDTDTRHVDYPDTGDHPINNIINNTTNNNIYYNTDVHKDTDPLLYHAQMIYDRYPPHRRGTLAQITKSLQQAKISAADYTVMLQQLDLWINSQDWAADGGQYVMGAVKWITTGRWRSHPRKPSIPERRDLSPDELWAIQQMMAADQD